ncbi:hypothetical protein ANANG_G00081390, partial [Anguilla anguilla]
QSCWCAPALCVRLWLVCRSLGFAVVKALVAELLACMGPSPSLLCANALRMKLLRSVAVLVAGSPLFCVLCSLGFELRHDRVCVFHVCVGDFWFVLGDFLPTGPCPSGKPQP